MEAEVFYGDCRDVGLRHSAEKQRNSAFLHFNHFLKSYCLQIGVDVVDVQSIPFEGIPKQETNKGIALFWDNVMASWITYLGTNARLYCKEGNERLSHQSASNYNSAMKKYFVDKFKGETLPVFQPAQWSRFLRLLQGFFNEDKRKNPKLQKNGGTKTKTSTREDREALATGCIWIGTVEGAEFWHLLNACYHCVGRGSEVSLATPIGLESVEVTEEFQEYRTLQQDIQKQKSGPFQSISIYPHRDGILEDFYFSLVYLVVMVGCGKPYITPNYAAAALNTNSKNFSDSKVSSLWKKQFEELREKFESLKDRVNEKLSSHSNKKGSAQSMAETPSVSGIALITRAAWCAKDAHTLFDYVQQSPVLSRESGKALAKWTIKLGDLVFGGIPPTFEDLNKARCDSPEFLRAFTDILFEDDVEQLWHPNVRELLVMTLFLRCDQFCDIQRSNPDAPAIANVPGGSCHNSRLSRDLEPAVPEHLFLVKVDRAGVRACNGDPSLWETYLNVWKSETNRVFLERNRAGLMKASLYGGDDRELLMDPRCLLSTINGLVGMQQEMLLMIQRQHHQLNEVCKSNRIEGTAQALLIGDMVRMRKGIDRLVAASLGEEPESDDLSWAYPFASKFSINRLGLSKNSSLAEVATAFVTENFQAGHELDKRECKNSDVPMPRDIKNDFQAMKRATRIVLMHCPSFPEKGKGFKHALKKVTTIAEERIRKEFEFGNGKLSIHTLPLAVLDVSVNKLNS